jgi:hypothetical protein
MANNVFRFPTLHREDRGQRPSMVTTLERLAGRTGAAFLPKGTLRTIVERAAEGGDGDARALLELGALCDGDDGVDGEAAQRFSVRLSPSLPSRSRQCSILAWEVDRCVLR